VPALTLILIFNLVLTRSLSFYIAYDFYFPKFQDYLINVNGVSKRRDSLWIAFVQNADVDIECRLWKCRFWSSLLFDLLIILVVFSACVIVKCCRLEQCLKEVVDYVDELSPGTVQHSVDAADALRQLSECRLVDKHTCSDVSMDSIHQMLKQMVSTLSIVTAIIIINHSVLWYCWSDDRNGIQPV